VGKEEGWLRRKPPTDETRAEEPDQTKAKGSVKLSKALKRSAEQAQKNLSAATPGNKDEKKICDVGSNDLLDLENIDRFSTAWNGFISEPQHKGKMFKDRHRGLCREFFDYLIKKKIVRASSH